jgi:AraC family transcriptional regulator
MDTAPEITNLDPGPAISIRAQLTISELPQFFGAAFGELAAHAGDQIAGPPFAIYHAFGMSQIDVEAVMPVRSAVLGHGRVQAIQLDGGPAVQVRHIGPYEELGTAYMSLEHWISDHHCARAAAIREVYLTEPTVPAAEHVTLVIQPLRDVEGHATT